MARKFSPFNDRIMEQNIRFIFGSDTRRKISLYVSIILKREEKQGYEKLRVWRVIDDPQGKEKLSQK